MNVNDLVEEAMRLISEPVDLSDFDENTPTDIVEDAYFARAKNRLDAWLADRQDRLSMLRHVRGAVLARASAYEAEAKRWATRAKRQERLVAYCGELALSVLRAERILCGLDTAEPYKVELPDGVKLGIRVSSAVQVADVDELPRRLVREKREADKVEIMKRLKAGEAVPGAKLVKNESMDWGR